MLALDITLKGKWKADQRRKYTVNTLGARYSIYKSAELPPEVLRKARDSPSATDYICDKGNRLLVR